MKKIAVLLALAILLLLVGCQRQLPAQTSSTTQSTIQSTTGANAPAGTTEASEETDAPSQPETTVPASEETEPPVQTEAPGYDMDAVNAYLGSVEAQADSITASLAQDELTQSEANAKAHELYVLWDDALNYLWGEVKKALPEESFDKLLDEQLVWIADKEAAVEEAGKAYEGGSIYPLIVNQEAATITETRVYELYDILDALSDK